MERGIQSLNRQRKLAEWGKQVEACRNSGKSVAEWCRENGIPEGTYYGRQAKVYRAAMAEQEVCFAEVAPAGSMSTGESSPIAAIAVAGTRIEVYQGADSKTLQAVLEAVGRC